MEVLYRAFDGKLFHSPEECLRHEKENPLFKMWGEDGLTTDPDCARVVHIIDEDSGANKFVELCEDMGVSYDGIEAYSSTGWYLWDDDQYVYIPDDTINAIMHASK